jgi:hypothetical protein
MKKVYKILVLTLILIALVVVAVLPSGVAFADQASHTVKFHFSSVDQDEYPLKDGFVLSIHMNGPNYFEKKEFQLHGAKAGTEFIIYRVLDEDLIFPPYVNYPAGTLIPSGESIVTDRHGNGHIITSMAPSAPNLQLLKLLGIDQLHITNVLYEGDTEAYKSEKYLIHMDFTWTP